MFNALINNPTKIQSQWAIKCSKLKILTNGNEKKQQYTVLLYDSLAIYGLVTMANTVARPLNIYFY